MSKRDVEGEIILCFIEQYPERYLKYNKLLSSKDICFRSQKEIREGIIIWGDMIFDLQFLIILIKHEGGMQ